MAVSEKILKHKSVFDEKHPTHNPPSIEDFNVLKPISRGAFGKVYLAQRKGRDKLYALKVMKKVDVLKKNMMKQVLAERDALALSSKCPYVVELYYSFQSKDYMFLVMDYMIGGDLKSILHFMGYFEEHMAKFYIGEVTLAVEYLHKHAIYHRDIKPDNMLISHTGHVKLTDFGLSVLSSERKPNFFNLVNRTPPDSLENKSEKFSSVFWRTPGQLQSLTSNFTFSAPSEKIMSSGTADKMHQMGSYLNNDSNFKFRSPDACALKDRSYVSTYDSKRSFKRTDDFNKIPNVKEKKVLFASNDLCLSDNLKSLNKKRELIEEEENENTQCTKRVRISLPVKLKSNLFSQNHMQCNSNSAVISMNTSVQPREGFGSDISISEPTKDSFVENMSVDRSVNHDHSDLSGVTLLSDTSVMSVSTVSHLNVSPQFHDSSHNSNISNILFSPQDTSSDIQDNTESKFQSPKLIDSDELDNSFTSHNQSAKNLDGDIELMDNGMSYSSPTSLECEFKGVDTTFQSNNLSYNQQVHNVKTPLRSPKNCVRGKVSVVDKRVIGTPDYLAPEILLGNEYGPPADWWALGVCFYEFVTGVPPFNDDTPDLVFEHILDNDYVFPTGDESLSECTEETIKLILTCNPDERPNAEDIKKMQCFHHLDWDNLRNEQAPFLPKPDDAFDTTYFVPKNLAYEFQLSHFNI